MSDEKPDVVEVPRVGLDLALCLMQAMTRDHEPVVGLAEQLLREKEHTREAVLAALDSIPCGGTTAEYEAGLRRVQRALLSRPPETTP